MSRKKNRSQRTGIGKAISFLVLIAMMATGGYLGWRYSQSARHTPVLAPLQTPSPEAEPPSVSQTIAQGDLLTGGTGTIPIIMYHDVLPRKEVWFDLTTAEFEAQMDELARAEAHPISMQTLYDHLQSNKPLPTHPIVLTFDDCTLGQFTDALPILQKHKFPAIFFVQTASVGVTTSKLHMTWEQLKAAEATGLITVESHTVTHPEDITKVSDSDLQNEMEASRQSIESNLGHPVVFLAYPSGNCDARVATAAKAAGYLAAVTMDRGWASCPAQSYYLPRFTPKRIEEVIDAWTNSGTIEPPLPRLVDTKDTPPQMGEYKDVEGSVKWIAGGDLGSVALDTRKTVGEMAQEANVQAALNGTFFSDARVQSDGGAMIGPVLSRVNSIYKPGAPDDDARISGRPCVLIGQNRCLVLPYEPHLGGSLDVLKSLLPDVKDAFVTGGWIVHNGKAISDDLMRTWSTGDANDPRHRAFVGIDSQNRYILGATGDSVSTRQLAQLLEKMQIEEAWLMDSGFSTSLIWQNRVLVSGHSRPDVPSRMVPHGLLLFGSLAPGATPPPSDAPVAAGHGAATTQEVLAADGSVPSGHRRRGRRHRKHHQSSATL